MRRNHARAIFVALVLSITAKQVSQSSMLHKEEAPERGVQSTLPTQTEITAVTTEIPVETAIREETDGDPEPFYRVYRITAYCDRGTTAAGVPSGVGQCAAPEDIPFGSEIYIPELDRTFIVTDRTAKRFRHNTVDLYMPDRGECKRFGRRYLECEITHPTVEVGYASEELGLILALAKSEPADKD